VSLKNGKEIWLKAGHAGFTRFGHDAIKTDRLARDVGKSRSSFYHLFGDREDFWNDLVEYALGITRQFSEETKDMQNFFPEYAESCIKYKDMIFFNRYLFLHRETDALCRSAWKRISDFVDDKTEELWMKMIDLDDLPKPQRERFYETIRSAAYMRLEYDDFTYDRIYNNIMEVNRSFGFLME
jgi:AcrR family transcriptional regulator